MKAVRRLGLRPPTTGVENWAALACGHGGGESLGALLWGLRRQLVVVEEVRVADTEAIGRDAMRRRGAGAAVVHSPGA
ncbi:hypothetical protein [Gordonia terrae]